MEITVLVLIYIGIGLIVIRHNGGRPKPLHLIAMTFFTMVMVYATFSLLFEFGQCFHVVKEYINLDVVSFTSNK